MTNFAPDSTTVTASHTAQPNVAVAANQTTVKTATPSTAKTTAQKKSTTTLEMLNSADSTYLYGADTTFAQLCSKSITRNDFAASATHTYTSVARDSSAQNTLTTLQTTATEYMQPTLRGTTPLLAYSDVVLTGVGVGLAILAVVKGMSASFIGEMTSFLTDGLGWKKMNKSASGQTSIALMLMDIFFSIVFAVTSVEALKIFAPSLTAKTGEWTLTGATLCIVISVYLAKFLIDRIIGFAFARDEQAAKLVLHKKTSCGIIGLALFPIALAIPFVSTDNSIILCEVAATIVGVLTIWRVARSMKIFMNDLPTFLHFILYLCVVEVAPLLLIYKLLTLDIA